MCGLICSFVVNLLQIFQCGGWKSFKQPLCGFKLAPIVRSGNLLLVLILKLGFGHKLFFQRRAVNPKDFRLFIFAIAIATTEALHQTRKRSKVWQSPACPYPQARLWSQAVLSASGGQPKRTACDQSRA